jgi:hypothetical protein
MKIESAKYIDDDNNNHLCVEAVIDGIKHWIPIEEGNRHYAEILKQVADGDLTIADAD